MSFYAITAITALAGAVASMIIGFVWYGPFFGKKWMEIMGVVMPKDMTSKQKMDMQKGMAGHYLANFVAAFVMFYALGFFAGILAAFIGEFTFRGALIYSIFVWIGFVVPVIAGFAIWSGKPKKLAWQMFGIMIGYQFLAILAAACLWLAMYPHLA